MNFRFKWRRWRRDCLSTSRVSILVHTAPTNEFSISKGVRQGDPLSLFLFTLAMEGLNIALQFAVMKGLFGGINIPYSGPALSHLFYANDALFVGEWSRSNLKNLVRILKCFQVSSGLKVNFHKSRVFDIGANPLEVANWSGILVCEPGSLPFTDLGVPIGANMNLKKH